MIREFKLKKEKSEKSKNQTAADIVQETEIQEKCEFCGAKISRDDLIENLEVCPGCQYHFRIDARKRIDYLVDPGSFVEFDKDLKTYDYLQFPDYMEKVKSTVSKNEENEGLVSGKCEFSGESAVVCIMNPAFLMGSMGAVVGEKITRAVEYAVAEKLPLVIFSSSGGARMQEGIISLMQMAKTSAAIGRLDEEGILYISVLTDPTTGGVTASFSMLGDLIIAEPGALIGFAGPRVIEQTIRQKLPEGFQRSEFLLKKGFLDKIVSRMEINGFLGKIIRMHKQEAVV